jgi:3-phosphoshikimate 1-carboxyvinyltransferase
MAEIGKFFGIESVFGDHEVRLLKTKDFAPPAYFEYNFIKVPDIAQSVSVLCGGLGTHGLFTGLQTLRIKETDRIAALQNEHAKMQVYLSKMPEKFSKKTAVEYYMQEGKSTVDMGYIPEIDTYNDHRMAMAYAPLGVLFPIKINDAEVISKSYPGFWKDLISLGFEIKSA